jgi:Xaa-Pro aminopeptidase
MVADLPGVGRAIDTAATASRRRALARRIGRGVVLVPAAHERDLELDYVQDNDFRQHNTFFYLTQLEAKDAWLVMTVRGPDSVETVLFLPPRNPARERWTGAAIGPDSVAARLTGIATVLPTDSLERRLQRVRFGGPGPVFVPLDVTTRHETRILDAVFEMRDARNLRPVVDSMRLVKDAEEIARLQRAVDVSVAGHVAAMQAVRPGMYEYELEAALEAGFRRNGADRMGYPSIVGSGPNGTTLHYDGTVAR